IALIRSQHGAGTGARSGGAPKGLFRSPRDVAPVECPHGARSLTCSAVFTVHVLRAQGPPLRRSRPSVSESVPEQQRSRPAEERALRDRHRAEHSRIRAQNTGFAAVRSEGNLAEMASFERILHSLGNGRPRRSLFGPVDREQLQMEYRAALHQELEDASRRWSFDFAAEKPLEGGDFQWVGVASGRVPLLYRSCQDDGKKAQRAIEDVSRVGKENIPKTPERYICANVEKTPEKRNDLKRKQTNITDFYQAKKRLVATPRKSGQ
ncbi:hypothetical protein DNTS_029347, partial [Danionella cerebrum]